MKKNTLIQKMIIASVLSGTLISPAFAVSRIQSQMEKITIEQCNSKNTKCLRATATKAIGSQFSSLQSLSNIEIQIFNSKNKLIQKLDSKIGYLDPELQRIVLQDKIIGRRAIETAIDLSTLVVETKVMK